METLHDHLKGTVPTAPPNLGAVPDVQGVKSGHCADGEGVFLKTALLYLSSREVRNLRNQHREPVLAQNTPCHVAVDVHLVLARSVGYGGVWGNTLGYCLVVSSIRVAYFKIAHYVSGSKKCAVRVKQCLRDALETLRNIYILFTATRHHVLAGTSHVRHQLGRTASTVTTLIFALRIRRVSKRRPYHKDVDSQVGPRTM